jgi:hypothetical protein
MSIRDIKREKINFHRKDAPKTEVAVYGRVFKDVVMFGTNNFLREEAFKKYYEVQEITVLDGRVHNGGKNSWKLHVNGFEFVKRPEYNFEDHATLQTKEAKTKARQRVNREFAPKVLELCKKTAGASNAYWMSSQRRAENGVNNIAERYATGFAHTDYGPENEEQFRTVLEHRYGLPHAEAQSCGVCLVNMWCPVERPAYKNPLALMDCSTMNNLEEETIRWKLDMSIDNGYDYQIENKGTKHHRPLNERVPQAAKDAPSLTPVFKSYHRYVYLPDMREDEAVIFKQVDFRKDQPARASFHTAVNDLYHKDDKFWQLNRRSIECRVILIFNNPELKRESKL